MHLIHKAAQCASQIRNVKTETRHDSRANKMVKTINNKIGRKLLNQ